MGKYFTIEELCYSNTAKKLGIDNTPNEEITSHLEELIEVLDKIRENWGGPIIVSSGYRCEELNKAVNGSKTSSHMTGYAVDMYPKNKDNKAFHRFVEMFLLDSGIGFDQLINEYPDENGIPSWTHLGLFNKEGKQRRSSFIIK